WLVLRAATSGKSRSSPATGATLPTQLKRSLQLFVVPAPSQTRWDSSRRSSRASRRGRGERRGGFISSLSTRGESFGKNGPRRGAAGAPARQPLLVAVGAGRSEPDFAGGVDVVGAVRVDVNKEEGFPACVAELPGAALPVVLQCGGAGGSIQEALDAREQLVA